MNSIWIPNTDLDKTNNCGSRIDFPQNGGFHIILKAIIHHGSPPESGCWKSMV
jgi:hypothetical protein